MRRLALIALAAAALAGCGAKSAHHPITPASTASVTVADPRGDAVDAGGNPRRGRPEVDIVRVAVDRNPSRTLFTITAAAAPRVAIRYEIFAQTPDVAGYDLVSVTRKGASASGYVAFENSAARQTLGGLVAKGPTLEVNVPIDPIFGGTPFQWRVTLRTASGAAISDVLPSASGLRSFPSG
jgi:hypothetical protein